MVVQVPDAILSDQAVLDTGRLALYDPYVPLWEAVLPTAMFFYSKALTSQRVKNPPAGISTNRYYPVKSQSKTPPPFKGVEPEQEGFSPAFALFPTLIKKLASLPPRLLSSRLIMITALMFLCLPISARHHEPLVLELVCEQDPL